MAANASPSGFHREDVNLVAVVVGHEQLCPSTTSDGFVTRRRAYCGGKRAARRRRGRRTLTLSKQGAVAYRQGTHRSGHFNRTRNLIGWTGPFVQKEWCFCRVCGGCRVAVSARVACAVIGLGGVLHWTENVGRLGAIASYRNVRRLLTLRDKCIREGRFRKAVYALMSWLVDGLRKKCRSSKNTPQKSHCKLEAAHDCTGKLMLARRREDLPDRISRRESTSQNNALCKWRERLRGWILCRAKRGSEKDGQKLTQPEGREENMVGSRDATNFAPTNRETSNMEDVKMCEGETDDETSHVRLFTAPFHHAC